MATTAPTGIVDTLSEGFAILHRRLWVLLIPLLLDLFLAFGPGISASPVVDGAIGWLDGFAAGDTGALSRDDLQEALIPPREAMTRFRETNLAGVLAWQLPSLVNATASTPLPVLKGGVFLQVESGWAFAGCLLVLAVTGLLGSSLYLAALAQPIRAEVLGLGLWLNQALTGWLKLLVYYGAILLLSLPVGGGALIFLALIGLFGSGAASFASGAALALAMTLGFYLFFVDDAIFVTLGSPFRAVWYSVRVVWRHFWQAVGFILVVNLILVGTPLVWRLLLEYPVVFVGAMAGHAYIAGGLTAAGMLFLKQRLPVSGRGTPAVSQ